MSSKNRTPYVTLLVVLTLTLGEAELTSAEAPITHKPVSGRLQLELEEQLGAHKYEIELLDQKKQQPALHFSAKTPQFDLQIPVGKYQIRGRVFDLRNQPGPWSSPEMVLVPPADKQRLRPPVFVAQEQVNPQDLSWQEDHESAAVAVNGVLEYQRFLSKEWKQIQKVTHLEGHHLPLDKRLPAGQYRWTIQFVDEVFGESAPAVMSFVVKPNAETLKELAQQVDQAP
jgi:hypothetical protein